MARILHQQAQELMQLHQTVGSQANLTESRAAREQTQWLGIMTWMEERECNRDACHEDDKLWVVGIMNMIAKVMKWVLEIPKT